MRRAGGFGCKTGKLQQQLFFAKGNPLTCSVQLRLSPGGNQKPRSTNQARPGCSEESTCFRLRPRSGGFFLLLVSPRRRRRRLLLLRGSRLPNVAVGQFWRRRDSIRRPERVLPSPRTFYCDRRVLEGRREELEKRRRRDCSIPGHTGEKTIHSKTFNTYKLFS